MSTRFEKAKTPTFTGLRGDLPGYKLDISEWERALTEKHNPQSARAGLLLLEVPNEIRDMFKHVNQDRLCASKWRTRIPRNKVKTVCLAMQTAESENFARMLESESDTLDWLKGELQSSYRGPKVEMKTPARGTTRRGKKADGGDDSDAERSSGAPALEPPDTLLYAKLQDALHKVGKRWLPPPKSDWQMYLPEKSQPAFYEDDDAASVASGDHDLTDKTEYGLSVPAGVKYYLQELEDRLGPASIFTWMEKMRRFLSVRKIASMSWPSYFSEFDVAWQELARDPTMEDSAPFSDYMRACFLLAFSQLSTEQYTNLMLHLDSAYKEEGGFKKMTHKEMEKLLRKVYASGMAHPSGKQGRGRVYAADAWLPGFDEGEDWYGAWDDDGGWEDQWEEEGCYEAEGAYYSHEEYIADPDDWDWYDPQDVQSEIQVIPSESDFANQTSYLTREDDELAVEFSNDNTPYIWDDECCTYWEGEWDAEQKCNIVKRNSPKQRRFPKFGKKNSSQNQGYKAWRRKRIAGIRARAAGKGSRAGPAYFPTFKGNHKGKGKGKPFKGKGSSYTPGPFNASPQGKGKGKKGGKRKGGKNKGKGKGGTAKARVTAHCEGSYLSVNVTLNEKVPMPVPASELDTSNSSSEEPDGYILRECPQVSDLPQVCPGWKYPKEAETVCVDLKDAYMQTDDPEEKEVVGVPLAMMSLPCGSVCSSGVHTTSSMQVHPDGLDPRYQEEPQSEAELPPEPVKPIVPAWSVMPRVDEPRPRMGPQLPEVGTTRKCEQFKRYEWPTVEEAVENWEVVDGNWKKVIRHTGLELMGSLASAVPASPPFLKSLLVPHESELDTIQFDSIPQEEMHNCFLARASSGHSFRSFTAGTEKCTLAAGYAIMDLGCTKGMMSEHSLRLLVQRLKESGPTRPVLSSAPSTTKYTFGDGLGKATQAGRVVNLLTGLKGKCLSSEWEILSQGRTPPLLSLPQMKNLGLILELGLDGCYMSSEVLGIKREKIKEEDGHLLFDLADFTPRKKSEKTNMATGQDQAQDLSTSVAPPTDTSTEKGDPISRDHGPEGLDTVGHDVVSTPNSVWDAIFQAFQASLDDGEFAHQFWEEEVPGTGPLGGKNDTAATVSGTLQAVGSTKPENELVSTPDCAKSEDSLSHQMTDLEKGEYQQALSAELSKSENEVEILNEFPSYILSDSPSGNFYESLKELPSSQNTVPGDNNHWHETLVAIQNRSSQIVSDSARRRDPALAAPNEQCVITEPPGKTEDLRPLLKKKTRKRTKKVKAGKSEETNEKESAGTKISEKSKAKTKKYGAYSEKELLQLHQAWGHCSAGQMMRRMKWGSYPSLGMDEPTLNKVLKKCPNVHCQGLVTAPKKPKASGWVPDLRNQIVAQDTVFPQIHGREYSLQHRVDCLTKLQLLHISRTNTMEDAKRAQQLWFTHYGPSTITHTDNGPEYGSAFTEHCQRNGVEHVCSPSYAPFSHGMVERSHQEAKRLIEITSNLFPRMPVADLVMICQQVLNENVKQNGKSSFENHFGRPARKPDWLDNPVLWTDAADEAQRRHEEALDAARIELIKLKTDDSIRKALSSRLNKTTADFTTGDKIWWFRVGMPGKLPRWVGPARCLARQGQLAVIVQGGIGHIIHSSRIRRYETLETPVKTADSDAAVGPADERLPLGVPRQDADARLPSGVPRLHPGEHDPVIPKNKPKPKTDFDLGEVKILDRQGRRFVHSSTVERMPDSLETVDTKYAEEPKPGGLLPELDHLAGKEGLANADALGRTRSSKEPSFGCSLDVEREKAPRLQASIQDFSKTPAVGATEFFSIETPDEPAVSPEDDTFGVVAEGFPDNLGVPPEDKTLPPSSTPLKSLEEVEAEIDEIPPISSTGEQRLHPSFPDTEHVLPQHPWPAPMRMPRIRQPPERFTPQGTIRRKMDDAPKGKQGKRASALIGNLLEELNQTCGPSSAKSACAALLAELKCTPDLPKPDLSFLFDPDAKIYDTKEVIDEKVYEAAIRELDILENCYKSKLVAEDTPMRELRKDEKDTHKELVGQARKTEYDSFLENDCIDFIRRSEVPKGRRVMKTRELLQWKEFRRKVKSRVVLKGFQDDRDLGAVDSPTLRQESFRLTCQYSCDKGWALGKYDLKTAFLQGFEYTDPSELVYFDPPPAMREYYGLEPDQVCIAKRSIYGLNDAPRRWFERLSNSLMAQGWERHWLDPCLFLKYTTSKSQYTTTELPRFSDVESAGNRHMAGYTGRSCIGAIGIHVDDLLTTGTPQVLQELHAFLNADFTVGSFEEAMGRGFLYRGLRLRKKDRWNLRIDMHEYEDREIKPCKYKFARDRKRATAKDQEEELTSEGQEWYRAIIGKLIWLSCQVRADLSTQVSQAASSLGRATIADAIKANGLIDQALTRKIALKFTRISSKTRSRTLKICCDAAFKNNKEPNCKSRGGMMLLLGTDTQITEQTALLAWSSKKLQRVCKSPTGAEVLTVSASVDEVDFAFHLAVAFYTDDLEFCSEIYTDSFSLTSTQDKYTKEINPNLQVDVAIIRQKVRNGEVRLTHIPGTSNPSDGLTKSEYVALDSLLKYLDSFQIGKGGTNYENLESLFVKVVNSVKVSNSDLEKALRVYARELEIH